MPKIAYILLGVTVAAALYIASTLFPDVHDPLQMLAALVVGILIPAPAKTRAALAVLLVSTLALQGPTSGCASGPEIGKTLTDVKSTMAAVGVAERFAAQNVYPMVSEEVAGQIARAFLAVRVAGAAAEAGTGTVQAVIVAYDSLLKVLEPHGGKPLGLPSPDTLVPLE